MRLCYVDESGDTGIVASCNSPVQPVLVIAAVVVDHSRLVDLTQQFISLKQRFSPNLYAGPRHRLDAILTEMKGCDLRRDAISDSRKQSRRAIGFLDKFVEILQFNRVKIFGRVWIKQINESMDGKCVYTFAAQEIFAVFQEHLELVKDMGFVIADSRNAAQNVPVAHAIFTQKFRSAGDPFSRIWEMPTFGHSNNHVGLQVADIIASALLFPICAYAYCSSHITNQTHAKPEYAKLRNRYGKHIRDMQFRYQDQNMKWRGGITVHDPVGKKSGAHIFSDCIGPSISVVNPPIQNVAAPINPPNQLGTT